MPKKAMNPNFCVLHRMDGTLTVPYQPRDLRRMLANDHARLGIDKPPITTDTLADMKALDAILHKGRLIMIVSNEGTPDNGGRYMSLVGVHAADILPAYMKAVELGATKPGRLDLSSYEFGRRSLSEDDIATLDSGSDRLEGLCEEAARSNVELNAIVAEVKSLPFADRLSVIGACAAGAKAPGMLELLVDLEGADFETISTDGTLDRLADMERTSPERLGVTLLRDGVLKKPSRTSSDVWFPCGKALTKGAQKSLRKDAVPFDGLEPFPETAAELAEAFGFEAPIAPAP